MESGIFRRFMKLFPMNRHFLVDLSESGLR
jgi:hypothetical protein